MCLVWGKNDYSINRLARQWLFKSGLQAFRISTMLRAKRTYRPLSNTYNASKLEFRFSSLFLSHYGLVVTSQP